MACTDLAEQTTLLAAQVGHLPEIQRDDDVTRQDQQVARVRVAVEAAELEDLPHDEVGPAARDGRPVQPRPRRRPGDWRA